MPPSQPPPPRAVGSGEFVPFHPLCPVSLTLASPSIAQLCCVVPTAGGVGCAWCLCWFLLVYEDPASHPWISAGEREYIVASLAHQVHTDPLGTLRTPVRGLLWCCWASHTAARAGPGLSSRWRGRGEPGQPASRGWEKGKP